RRRPPRPQAGQRPCDRGRTHQGARLRPGRAARRWRRVAHPEQRGDGHGQLHGAGAAQGRPPRRSPRRSLLVRGDDLRAAHRGIAGRKVPARLEGRARPLPRLGCAHRTLPRAGSGGPSTQRAGAGPRPGVAGRGRAPSTRAADAKGTALPDLVLPRNRRRARGRARPRRVARRPRPFGAQAAGAHATAHRSPASPGARNPPPLRRRSAGALRPVEEDDRQAVEFVVAGLDDRAIDDLEVAVGAQPARDLIAELVAFFRLGRREQLDAREHLPPLSPSGVESFQSRRGVSMSALPPPAFAHTLQGERRRAMATGRPGELLDLESKRRKRELAVQFIRRIRSMERERLHALILEEAGEELAQFFLAYASDLIDREPHRAAENASSLLLIGYLIRAFETEAKAPAPVVQDSWLH